MEAWLVFLNRVIDIISHNEVNMAILISGWATKVRHGFSQRRWCRLVGRALFYSIKERGEHLGAILLQGADVSAHQQADESDNEEASDSAKMNYCLQINCDQGKYFFLFQSEEIRDKWSYFCMMASGRVPLDVGKQSSEPSNPQSPPTLRALVPSEPSSYPQSPRRTLRALVPSNPRTLAPSEPSYSQSPRTLVPSYPQSPRTLRALVPSELLVPWHEDIGAGVRGYFFSEVRGGASHFITYPTVIIDR